MPRVVEALVECEVSCFDIRMWFEMPAPLLVPHRVQAIQNEIAGYWYQNKDTIDCAQLAEWCAERYVGVNAVQVKLRYQGFSILIYPDWP
jgi:hypothetical protein